MARSLASELGYFNAHCDRLRAEAAQKGKKVVVIHDRTVQGYFNSVVEAANYGYETFGSDPFLARTVEPEQHEPSIASIFG